MKAAETLKTAWARFDDVKVRLLAYIGSSEAEFAGLIEALDSCWTLAEAVQGAAGRLTAMTGVDAGSPTGTMRDTLLSGCQTFREFLEEIGEVSEGLSNVLDETRSLLRNSMRLQEDLLPLNYIAFAFRLEGARLPPENNGAMVNIHGEMQMLLGSMKRTGESQQQTLSAIVERLAGACASINQAAASFAQRASSSEEHILADLALLSEVPSNLKESRKAAASTGTLITDAIREAAKALQGHDAIRQQTDHVFASLEETRRGRGLEEGHALVLQRQQAKHIQQLIAVAGQRIERELKTVTKAAESIASHEGDHPTVDTGEAQAFEKAADRLTAMSLEIAGLLDGECTLGRMILTEIEPVHALLSSKSHELEVLAFSLKMLALNVLITAEQIPGAREVDVLGTWTADAAGRVLELARSLNEQFSQIGTTLAMRGQGIVALLDRVESSRRNLLEVGENGDLRNTRRAAYSELGALGKEAQALQGKTEALLQTLTFVDQGHKLFDELVGMLEMLLLLYPPPLKPLDTSLASAGYAMQDQHEVHAQVFGGDASAKFARLSEPAPDADYGDNVELF